MDPLSVTASSIAIATICSQVITILSKWISGRHADQILHTLNRELGLLSTTLTSITALSQRPDVIFAPAHEEDGFWNNVNLVLRSCKSTMRLLRRLLRDISAGIEAGSIWRRSIAHILFQGKKSDIAELLRDIQSSKATLQIALQCATMFWTAKASFESEERDSELLNEIKAIKKYIVAMQDTTRSSGNGKNPFTPWSSAPFQGCLNASQLLINQSATAIHLRSTTQSLVSSQQASMIGSPSSQLQSSPELCAALRSLIQLVKTAQLSTEVTVTETLQNAYASFRWDSEKEREELIFMMELTIKNNLWDELLDTWGAVAITLGATKELRIFLKCGSKLDNYDDLCENSEHEEPRSLLAHAILLSNISCVEILLDAGAKMFSSDNTVEDTATELLLLTAFHGSALQHSILTQIELIKLALDRGADINASTKFSKRSALYFALQKDDYDVAEYLVYRGAKIDIASALKLIRASYAEE